MFFRGTSPYRWQTLPLSADMLILLTVLCLIYSFVLRTGLQLYHSFFHASTWTLTLCVGRLICSSLVGEIGGRSLGEIDGKMGWNLLSGSERMESALLGIKGTVEWESLDNVFNFFEEADDSNLPSQIPVRNVLARLISCYSELIASLWTHLCLILFRSGCRLSSNTTAYSKHRSSFSWRGVWLAVLL